VQQSAQKTKKKALDYIYYWQSVSDYFDDFLTYQILIIFKEAP
jgi:hypothetical protein